MIGDCRGLLSRLIRITAFSHTKLHIDLSTFDANNQGTLLGITSSIGDNTATLMDVRAEMVTGDILDAKMADLDPRQEEVTSVAPCAGPAASPDTHEFSFRINEFNSWVVRGEWQYSDVWNMGLGLTLIK